MNQISVSEFIDSRYKDYSKYVIYFRAIPHIIDGMKPSQRKVVYTANKVARSNKIKTASLAGEGISKANYHHGDVSLADTIIGMTQEFNNNIPLLQGEGSFGSRLVPKAASPRYTFVRLSSNFDKYFMDYAITESLEDPEDPEPKFYLPVLPWVLVNGIKGIAVGFATEIFPRSKDDLIKACVDYLKGENIDDYELPPSFPHFTGEIGKESDGRWYCKGNYRQNSATNIEITEVPVGYDREKYILHLESLKENNKIVSYTDRCSKQGFHFVVKLKKGSQLSDDQIVDLFNLKKTLNENLTTIDEHGNLNVFDSPNDIVKHFCDYRKTKYTERFAKYISDAETKKALLEDKKKFIENALHDNSLFNDKTRKQLKDEIGNMGIHQDHIQNILDIPVYNINKDYLADLKKQITELKKNIKEWKSKDINDAFIEDLQSMG